MPRPTVTRARAVFSSQGPVLYMAWIELATGGYLGVVFAAEFTVRETMRQKRSPPEAEREREARTKDSELKKRNNFNTLDSRGDLLLHQEKQYIDTSTSLRIISEAYVLVGLCV